MKKLFNNSTKTEETASKSKRKFLKTFSFTSLALLMGIAGTMAFAPLGASPNNLASASELETTTITETGGLIVPKKDDPVIYTTESGIDIKWGNASTTALGGGNEKGSVSADLLATGNLKGYPYFTTKGSSKDYIWVIIGKSTSGLTGLNWKVGETILDNEREYQKLSYWKTNKASSGTYEYFFDSIYESATPAGSAINSNNTLSDYVARYLSEANTAIMEATLSSRVANAEIPSGCILAWANDIVTTVACGSAGSGGGDLSTQLAACSFDSLGLTPYTDSIVAVSLQRRSWDNGTSSFSNIKLFHMGGVKSSFKLTTYVTTQSHRASTNKYWSGDGYAGYTSGAYLASGAYNSITNTSDYGGHATSGTCGVRPAFCLKMV